jgi:hypothetical protein
MAGTNEAVVVAEDQANGNQERLKADDGNVDLVRARGKGAAKWRAVYSDEQKWRIRKDYETRLNHNQNIGGNVHRYIKTLNLPLKYKDFLSTATNGCHYPERKTKIFNHAKDKNLQSY